MAQMIPAVPPPRVQGKQAEYALYEALRARLSNDFFVYHNLDFLERDTAAEGEVDFLLVHREKGMLVLECKGGGVRRLGGIWYRRGPGGVDEKMHNPFDQAQGQVKKLVRELKARMAGAFPAQFPFVTGHSVAFPFARRADVDLPLDAQPQTVLLADDIPRLGEWVEEALTFWRRSMPPPESLSPADFSRFQRQVLHPELRFVPTLGARMVVEADALARLTDEQVETLKGCLENRRLRVTGAAGTGKTVLALEAARCRASQSGQAALIVCFNKALAAHLAALVVASGPTNGTIDVLSFHALCKRAFEALGRPYEPPSDKDPVAATKFWDVDAPSVLYDALAAGKVPRYDAIVVDEAQDFHADWSTALEACLRDEKNGSIVVFYDPGQKIFGRKSGLSELPAAYSLTVNFRNSQQIAKVVGALGGVETKPHARVPVGEPPTVHVLAGPAKARLQVEELVRRLVELNDVRPEQMVILTPHRRDHSSLKGVTSLAGIPLADNPADRKGKVLHTTIGAYKGLESDVVILLDVDPSDERCDRRARYVGASRARLALHVFAKGDWMAA